VGAEAAGVLSAGAAAVCVSGSCSVDVPPLGAAGLGLAATGALRGAGALFGGSAAVAPGPAVTVVSDRATLEPAVSALGAGAVSLVAAVSLSTTAGFCPVSPAGALASRSPPHAATIERKRILTDAKPQRPPLIRLGFLSWVWDHATRTRLPRLSRSSECPVTQVTTLVHSSRGSAIIILV
jgi:hypothetical protein